MKRKKVHFDSDLVIRGDFYWYKGTPEGHGKQVERSLKIKVGASQKDVRRAKLDLLEHFKKIGKNSRETSFEKLVAAYIKEKEDEGLAIKTLYEIKSYLGVKYEYRGSQYFGKHLGPYYRKFKVENIDQISFDEFCEENKGQNFKPHIKVLNAFLKWCVQKRILRNRYKIEIPKKHRKEKRKREVLENHEIIGLLNHLSGRALLYHSMYLLMGMRNSEIIKLKWSEVDLEDRSLWVNPENNRTRKDREIPINPFIFKMLCELDRGDSDWVFPSRAGSKKPHMDPSSSFRKDWKRALADAGITRHLTPHDMRATFETFMHTNTAFTDTQREKMAGARIDVQKDLYVSMRAKDLRGLEESVQVEGLGQVFEKKNQLKLGQKAGHRKAQLSEDEV